jgi:hypothetical protein
MGRPANRLTKSPCKEKSRGPNKTRGVVAQPYPSRCFFRERERRAGLTGARGIEGCPGPWVHSPVLFYVLPEFRSRQGAVGDIERHGPEVCVLRKAALRDIPFPEDCRGVFGDLDEFGGDERVQPEEIPEHLPEFFISMHTRVGGEERPLLFRFD